jgi:SAM-dependent methyltransferase
MTAAERRALIQGAVEGRSGAWADLGSGEGAFTSALASLLLPGSRIYSIEKEGRSLRAQRGSLFARFPDTNFELMQADFTGTLSLPPLEGILMANALHYQEDPCGSLAHVAEWLKPGGLMVVVEYDISAASPWIPYPVPAARMPAVSSCAGLEACRIIATMPSRFHHRMYAAVCVKGGPA